MKPITSFIVFTLLLPVLAAQEPPRKPARDSYRPYIEAWGQPTAPEDVRGQYLKLTVSPAQLPDPLLKYRLRVFSTEKESGNAVYLYTEALAELNRIYHAKIDTMHRSEEFRNNNLSPGSTEYQQTQFKAFPLYPYWGSDSYVEITAEEEAILYASLSRVYELLELASRKTYCDWGDTSEFKGIGTLLPHLQEMRTLGRYLSGKANWEIRNGNYEDAIQTIRIGLVLGQHVRDSKSFNTLVSGLVGLAIQGIMQASLHDLASQPDAPNMYAALTQLEFSVYSLLTPMEGERSWVLTRRPFTPNLYDTINKASDEECRAVLCDLVDILSYDDIFQSDAVMFYQTESGRSVALSFVCLFSYPFAKERLTQQGKTDEEIDAMSTYKVVTPYVLEEIQRAYDLVQVNAALPPGESRTAIQFDESFYYGDKSSPVKILLALFLPATQAARNAYLRTEQTLDRLKIIEAIRLYAAMNDGRLPQALDDIKEVPVPKTDVMTGKPYNYRVEGNTASVDYMTSSGLSRMEIVLQ